MSNWTRNLFDSLANSDSGIQLVGEDIYIPYKKILNAAIATSNQLRKYESKIVSCIIPNSAEFIVLFLACAFTNKIFAPIPYFLSASETSKILDYHGSKLLFTDRTDIKFSFSSNNIDSISAYLKFDFSDKTDKYDLHKARNSDIMCLYYSSGTTGNPKGVLYSHSNIYALIKSICSDFNFSQKTRHLAFLPFGHTASLNYSVFPTLYLGSPLIIAKNFDLIRANFFKTLSQYSIHYVQTVPTVIHTLLKLNEKTKHLSLHNLKFIGCGSSFLPIDTQVRFKEIFNLSIANLYGLSETGPTHFDNPKSKNWKPGSIGIPLSVNQCKIAQDGEILIRGKNVFAGYHKNHKLFKRVVKNKWFHTGDYGKKENGKFFYLDRKKDIAIIGGMNVYPAEIEEVLQQIDQVSEACVFGVKDKINGEYLVAYIILKDSKNPNISNESIYKHLRENLSNFKVPREVFFVKKFPKTASGKVLKRELKERYIQEKTHE